MKSPAQRWAVVALVVVVGLGIAGWAMLANRGNPPQDAEQAQAKPGDADEAADADHVMVGGVRRKRSDIEPAANHLKPADDEESYGSVTPVPANLNPQVASAAEVFRNNQHPERVSILLTPQAFDAKAFEEAPQKYLDVVEPGRVFQTAQPGPGVSPLSAAGPTFQYVRQGGVVELRAKAPPKAPVTFTTLDLGEFENRLTSYTAVADESGVAEAKFFATPGAIEDVHILAGSPLASGQVQYIVNIQGQGSLASQD
jgi:hypothetical protein